jgi:hypothetical protein
VANVPKSEDWMKIVSESLLVRKRDQDTTLKPRESAVRRRNAVVRRGKAVRNQDLTSRAA